MKRINNSKDFIEKLKLDLNKKINDFKVTMEKNFDGKTIDKDMSFETEFLGTKLTITIPKEPIVSNEKAIITFSEKAYIKINHLVCSTPKEIAWHGSVKKLGVGNYLIEDIFLYPQTVTDVAADPIPDKYDEWWLSQTPEFMEACRFQGHSHVNMCTNPSGKDRTNYDMLLKNIENENTFYLFGIFNKLQSKYFEIWDFQDNMIYDNADIVWKIEGLNIEQLDEDILSNVKDPLPRETINKNVTIYSNKKTDYDYNGYDEDDETYYRNLSKNRTNSSETKKDDTDIDLINKMKKESSIHKTYKIYM